MMTETQAERWTLMDQLSVVWLEVEEEVELGLPTTTEEDEE